MLTKTKEILKIVALLAIIALCVLMIKENYFNNSEAAISVAHAQSNSNDASTAASSNQQSKDKVLTGRPDPLGVNSHSPLVNTAAFEVASQTRLQTSPCNLGEEEKWKWFWVNTDMVMQCVTVVVACSEEPLTAYSCENVSGGRGNTSITVRDSDGKVHSLPARSYTSFAPNGDSHSSLERLFGKGAQLRVTIPLRGLDTTGLSSRWTLVREESQTSASATGNNGGQVVVRQVVDPGLQKRIDELERLVAQPRVVEVPVDPRPAIETRRPVVLN